MLSLQLATTITLALVLLSVDGGQMVESNCIVEHHYYFAANASDDQYIISI